MTVETPISKDSYPGNDVTTVFTINFRILDETHLDVNIVDDVTGIETPQTLTADYTITGVGDPAAQITMLVAPATDTTLVVLRAVPRTQKTNYVEGDKFPAQSHEDALDKLTMIVQEMSETLDNVVAMNNLFTGADVKVDDPVADTALVWDPTATKLSAGPTTTEIAGAEAAGSAATASAAAAAVSESNAATSETNAGTSETNAAASAVQADDAATIAATIPGVLAYTFNSSTGSADPGTGKMSFNNASPDLVTEVYINNVDSFATDISAYIDEWGASNSTIKSIVLIRGIASPEELVSFNVTNVVNSIGYRTLTVQYVTHTLNFTNLDAIQIFNDRTGEKGADGAGSGDMNAATYDPLNKVADAFDMDNMVEGTSLILTAAERANVVTNNAKLTANEANVVAALSGASITGVTLAADDKILIQDTSNGNALREVDPDEIAALATGPAHAKSGNLTYPLGTTVSFSHGLGGDPDLVWGEFYCNTIDGGWQVGDRIPFQIWTYYARQDYMALSYTSTTVTCRQNGPAALRLPQKNASAEFDMAAASWRIILHAVKF